MEPRCPKCTSLEIAPTRLVSGAAWVCDRCGAMFDLGEALVTVDEVHAAIRSDQPAGFSLDEEGAQRQLRKGEGAIRLVDRFSDPDELHGLLVSALETSVIEVPRTGAYLRIVPSAVVRPGPFLIVEPGGGVPSLAAGDLHTTHVDDPVQFTMILLRLVVERANRVLSTFLLAQSNPEPTPPQSGPR